MHVIAVGGTLGSSLFSKRDGGKSCVGRATLLGDRFRLSHSGVADAAHATSGAAGGLEAGTGVTSASRRSMVLGEELSVHSSSLERNRQRLREDKQRRLKEGRLLAGDCPPASSEDAAHVEGFRREHSRLASLALANQLQDRKDQSDRDKKVEAQRQ